MEYIEIGSDGVKNVSEQELKDRLRNRYFEWLSNVGKIVGWSDEETANQVEDVSWFFCFDDGLSPEQAVKIAREKGII